MVGLRRLALAGGRACDGTAEPGGWLESIDHELETKPERNKHKLAKKFRVTAAGPSILETRSGQPITIPLDNLELELEEAEAPSTAPRGTGHRRDRPETPSRRAQPAVDQAQLACPGTPSPGISRWSDMTIPPEVLDDSLPRRAQVPVISVEALQGGLPVIATRVRVPVMQIMPPQPSRGSRKRKPVVMPGISIGLAD